MDIIDQKSLKEFEKRICSYLGILLRNFGLIEEKD
jgi:hypothetical protein